MPAVGYNVSRKDGIGKATGRAKYADDLVAPGMLHGRTIRSTIARGRTVRRVRLVELSPDDARPLLRAFPEEVPTGVGFMKRSGLVVDGRPEEFEALAGRCAVFRLDGIQ